MFIREASLDRAAMCPDGKKNLRLTAAGPHKNCESIELRLDLFALEARGSRRTVHVPLSNVDYWEPDEERNAREPDGLTMYLPGGSSAKDHLNGTTEAIDQTAPRKGGRRKAGA